MRGSFQCYQCCYLAFSREGIFFSFFFIGLNVVDVHCVWDFEFLRETRKGVVVVVVVRNVQLWGKYANYLDKGQWFFRFPKSILGFDSDCLGFPVDERQG